MACLKELKKENGRLRNAVSDLTREKLILKEAASGDVEAPSRRRRGVDHVMSKLSAWSVLPARFLSSITRSSAGSRQTDRMKGTEGRYYPSGLTLGPLWPS